MSSGAWLFGWMFVGWVFGYTLHEVAHYIPLRLSKGDRDVTFSLLPPEVTFMMNAYPSPIVRFAAIAPWVCFLLVAAVMIVTEWGYTVNGMAFWILASLKLLGLSKADREIAFARPGDEIDTMAD